MNCLCAGCEGKGCSDCIGAYDSQALRLARDESLVDLKVPQRGAAARAKEQKAERPKED